MADQTVVSMVEKLIRLATNNPSEQEAQMAALKACELIQKFSIPLGAEVVIVKDREWRAPSEDFMRTVDDILKGTRTSTPDQSQQEGLVLTDRDLVTREEAFRRQMQRAWQAIRDERKRFEAWVHDMRIRHGLNFWTTDHQKPW